MLRVYVCGAHSTGKTTLLDDLKLYVNLRFEEEVARNIIKRRGWIRNDFLPSTQPETFVQLNREILEAHITIDRENTEKGIGFICDRGVDPFVYVEQYIGPDEAENLYKIEGIQQWLTRMSESVVFVLYPHKECISDGGVRLPPTIEELNIFKEKLEEVLNRNNIPFHKITCLDRKERLDTALNIIKQICPGALKM